MQTIKSRTGAYCRSCNPGIYSAIAIARAQRRAAINRAVSSLRIRWQQLVSVLGHNSVGSPDQPVVNVYAASLAAQAVYIADPGCRANIIRLFERLLHAD
jgi:hypothetical protein